MNAVDPVEMPVAVSRKRRIGQALVAIPGLILLYVALHGAFADYRHIQDVRRRAEARTAQAEATVIETHDLVSGKGVRMAQGAGTFSFTTDSGKEVRIKYRGFTSKPGEKLHVRYDPRDPENYALGNDLFGYSDLLMSNMPPFLISLYLLFLAVRMGRP